MTRRGYPENTQRMGKTTNPWLWPVCDRATVFIHRGDERGMRNCPENAQRMGKTTNPLLWPVCDRATVFIHRGGAPGMRNCPENRRACHSERVDGVRCVAA